MLRGITLFKCTHCGKLFIAPDIEFMMTAFSMPQPCPKCGSKRTRPAWKDNKIYERIWEEMEK